MITVIEFADMGQQSRRWIVDDAGRVIQSTTMEYDVWVGCRIVNFGNLKEGDRVTIEPDAGEPLKLAYPVEAIFTLPNLAYRKGAA